MKKKGNTKKAGIIVAILVLAVGFAAVTTTLYINGTIKIVPDYADFKKNVVFTDVTCTNTATGEGANSCTAELLPDSEGNANKVIRFTTHIMKEIGETSVLSYKVKNDSQYGAELPQLVCTASTVEGENGDKIIIGNGAVAEGETKYFRVVPENLLFDGTKNRLASGTTSETDKVTVSVIRSYVGEENVPTETPETLTAVFTCSYDNIQAYETDAPASTSSTTTEATSSEATSSEAAGA